jgi:RNA polymerase sigma factor (sigma-70 family)
MQPEEYAVAFETGYGTTRRFLISRGAAVDDAEEIAQAAWVRGWEYREQLRDPGLVSYWVNSIARNLFRARFRAITPLSLELTQDPSYVFDTAIIDVHRMLEQCGERDRALLEKSLAGYSAEEMAQGTGISPTGVRVRLLRARQSMRNKLVAA